MKSKLITGVVIAALTVLLVACGGGGGSGDDNAGNNSGNNASGNSGDNRGGGSGEINPSVSVQSVYDYMAKMMAGKDENSTPVDVNALTLAVDDNSPPVALTP